MDLCWTKLTTNLWAIVIVFVSFTDSVLSQGHADLVYGQWTFHVHKRPATWSQATATCKKNSGKLFEPSNEQGRALTSILLMDQPFDYRMWIGMYHNDTNWNFSDARINETYDDAEAAWYPTGRLMVGIRDGKPTRGVVSGPSAGTGTDASSKTAKKKEKYFRSACAVTSTENNTGWHLRNCVEKYSFICEYSEGECADGSYDVTYSEGEQKRCFQFRFEDVDWYQARRSCRKNNSRLAILDKRDIHTLIAKYVDSEKRLRPQLSGRHWHGLSKIVWRWQNGDVVEEEGWSEEGPDEDGGACVAMVHNDTGRYVWQNQLCDNKLPFICVHTILDEGYSWNRSDIKPGDAKKTPKIKPEHTSEDGTTTYVAIGLGAGTVITTLIAIPCCCCCRRKATAKERRKRPYASMWNNPACLSITEETAPVERMKYQGQPRPGMEGPGGYSAPLPSAPYEHTYESPYAYIPGEMHRA